MNSQIVYLDVRSLVAHPDNPRKDLGDLTELAESIRLKGVMQNLTVVPDETNINVVGTEFPYYRIVIGHRRAAAAKLAGVETVPCVISNMDPREQLETMLLENMQRSDLTVLEQARGFQMMLNFGESIESISQKTGFSESTVRRRVKLMELDQNNLERAIARGGSLMDYLELDKISDPALRDKVLCDIGTGNFKNTLMNALREEKDRQQLVSWESIVSTFAKKIDAQNMVDGEPFPMDYVYNIARWNTKNDSVRIPEDIASVKYFYIMGRYQIDIYSEHIDRVDPKIEAKRAADDAYTSAKERLIGITHDHYQMRLEFIRDLTVGKKHLPAISKLVGVATLYNELSYEYEVNQSAIKSLFGIGDKNGDISKRDLYGFIEDSSAFDKYPEHAILSLAFSMADKREKYWETRWDSVTGRSYLSHKGNVKLDMIYAVLLELGYEMSDEERKMLRGTHELLERAEDHDPDPDDECDDDEFDEDDDLEEDAP